MKKWIFLGLLALLSLPLGAEASVVVLCYHSFLGKNYVTDFAPPVFQKQLTDIKALGYQFVSFDELVQGRMKGNKNVLLTIDDGNVSVKAIYQSILIPLGIQPILFIFPSVTDRSRLFLTYKDLALMEKEGALVGGHGYTHQFMTQKFFAADPKAFKREIFLGKERLETRLKVTMDTFAYPFGATSAVAEETLKKAGYTYGFSLVHDRVKVPLSLNADPLILPRYMVTKTTWAGIFQMMKNDAKTEKPGAAL